jgi:hypothetical protein
MKAPALVPLKKKALDIDAFDSSELEPSKFPQPSKLPNG